MKWKTLFVSLILIAMGSLFVDASPAQQADHRTIVIKFMEEVWKKGNLAHIDQVMDPNVIRFGHVAEGNTNGIAAYKALVTKVRSAFTDYNITLLDLMGDGNKATFKWQLRGNYVGPDQKISPGRSVDILGKTIWIFRDGKVIREVVEMDAEEYHRQIELALPYSEVHSRALMLSYLYEVINHGDVSAIEELVSDRHVLHTSNNRDLTGQEALREHVLTLRTAFPDLSVTINEVIADGNIVSARWTLSGTHRAEWNGIPASNRQVKATGLTMMRIKDEKIQETWNVVDLVAIGVKVN
jgi:steroid delta-isomerase-like uncharacterized protein